MNTAAKLEFVEEQKPGKEHMTKNQGLSKRIRNVVLRENGIYYFAAVIHGRRYFESLDTRDRKVAATRAKTKREAAKKEKWDELDATRIKRRVATIGEVCDAYVAMMKESGRVRPATAHNNVATFLRIVRTVQDTKTPRDVSAAVLTGAFAKAYAAALAPGDQGAKVDENRIRRTIASSLTHARSVVRRKLWEDYRQAGVVLPNLDGFLGQFVTKNPKVRYQMPPRDLYEPTIEAGRRLKAIPGLVWTLAYDLGMRAGEIVAAKWSWIEQEDTPAGIRWWMVVKDGPDFQPKGVSGKIPIFDGVHQKLMALRGAAAGEYILPLATRTEREDAVKRDFAEWMRGKGWTTQKCAHELRKLRGCWWFARYGMERTYKWLRHANMQTTLDHYADLPMMDEPHAIEAPGPQWAQLTGR